MTDRMRRRGRLGSLAVLLTLAACGATDCGGCLAPLDEPFPEARKFGGAGQVRLTPSGVAFLESNLPTIIQSFAAIPCDPAAPDYVPCPSGMTCVDGQRCEEGGQPRSVIGFRIPYASVADPPDCYDKVTICDEASSEDCLVHVQLNQIGLEPTAPNLLDIDVATVASSTWIPLDLSNECGWKFWCCFAISPDCKIRIAKKNRPMSMQAQLLTDNPLQRLEVGLGDPDIPLEASDLEIDSQGGFGSWLGCGTVDLLMPLLFPLFRDTLRDELNATVKDAVTDMSVEACQSAQDCSRPDLSYCDGDGRCRFSSNNRYVPTLMGVEGGLDLASLLGAFAGQASAAVGISLAAGGYAEVVAEGIEIGMRGGTDVQASLCVPPMDAPLPLPTRLDFGNSVPHPVTGQSVPFMTGIAVSDRLLDEVLRGAVQSGALCQRIDSGLSSYINTGALGLLASSLGNLTRGGAKPALIEILPRAPIRVDVGLGTTAVDPTDPNRSILDKPLLTLHARDLDLDLYGLVDDRYLRFMTMRAHLRIGIGLEDDGQGNMLVLVSGVEDWIQDVQVLNSELLTDDPQDIATAVPALISAMLGQFAPDLSQLVALPDLAGFTLQDLTIRGVQQRVDGSTPVVDAAGNAVFEFMGIFANLSFDPAAVGSPLRYTVDTVASVRRLVQPPTEAFDVAYPGGPQRPLLELDVAAAHHDGDDVEFSHRVDGGYWRPFHRGRVLSVTDPLLQLMGRHQIEVRGRRVGAPATLDPSPATIEVIVDPLAPELEVQLVRSRAALLLGARDGVSPAEALRVQVRVDGALVQEQQGLASVALDPAALDGHRIEVEVLDEAGNVARWSHGQPPPLASPSTAVLERAAPELDAQGGASGCAARRAAGAGWGLWLLGLFALRRRQATARRR